MELSLCIFNVAAMDAYMLMTLPPSTLCVDWSRLSDKGKTAFAYSSYVLDRDVLSFA